MQKLADNNLARLINGRMIELGLNAHQLSKQSGLCYSTIHRMLHKPDYSTGRKKIEKLVNFLQMPMPSLDGKKDETEAMLIFRNLPEDKKSLAVSLLNTLKDS